MFSSVRHVPGSCCRLFVSKRHIQSKSIGVIGVPFEKGQMGLQEGASEGPSTLRKYGLIEQLKHGKCKVTDYGDVQYEPLKLTDEVKNMHFLEHVSACQKVVSEKVLEVMKEGKMALTLGGDHTTAIGSIDGHIKAKGKVAVIWVDAHADLNTAETSPSGNVHGMSLALLCKELVDYWPYLPGMDWQWPEISVRNVAYIGLRDIDVSERIIIDKFQIVAYGMEEVQRIGIAEVIHQAINRIDRRGNLSLHLSFDIDALDAMEVPSTGLPVRGGLLLREGIQIVEECYRTGRLGAMDLVEFNPKIGNERDVRNSGQAGILLCKAASGYSRSGLLHTHEEDIPMPSQKITKPNDKKE